MIRVSLVAVCCVVLCAACGDDGDGVAGSGGSGAVAGAAGSGASAGSGATAGTGGSGASGGSGATGGSGGNSGSGGAAGSAGGGGSSGGGGSAGSAGNAGSGGGGPLTCSTGGESFSFTVTQTNQFKKIALPFTPGVEYRRVTLEFSYVPTAWSGTCFNPATTKGSGFPIFESWLALKRGNHWCKGGNAFEVSLQGPASGHGASNKASSASYYKAQQHTGSGCGGSDVEAKIFSGLHGITTGTKYSAKVVFDQTAGTLTANVGPSTHSGPLDPKVKLIANGTEVWNVVLSFDGGYLECYNSSGQQDPSQPCCYGPSVGWVYENLSWEVCY